MKTALVVRVLGKGKDEVEMMKDERVNPLCPMGISPKYDSEIIYADSVRIIVGFGRDLARRLLL